MIRKVIATFVVFAGLSSSYVAMAQVSGEMGCISRCNGMGIPLEDCVYICIPM